MAEYTLIDGYLDVMRSEIHWRKDIDDVVSEMEDHLYSSVEYLVARGHEPDSAQRTTLDRFGEPSVLAAVYASTPTGGLAVPTQTTRRLGTVGMVGGALWFAAAIVYFLFNVNEINGGDNWLVYYSVFQLLVLVAGAAQVIAMIGISKRSGGLGAIGLAGLALVGLGVFVGVAFAWAIPLWMGIQGAGLLLFGISVMRAGFAPKNATVATMIGFIVGAILWVLLEAAGIGPVDFHGLHTLGYGVGGGIGMVIAGGGILGWSNWLRTEKPVDIEPTAIPA